MNMYKISQEVNNEYDTYDSAVVSARNEEEARHMQPSVYGTGWCEPQHVTVELIGTAKRGTQAGLILASFNAG